MVELFEMVRKAPTSKHHTLTFDFHFFNGEGFATIYVHKCDDGTGFSIGIDDYRSTFQNDMGKVKSWLGGWIGRIEKEREEDADN